jgi:hypothetical protein
MKIIATGLPATIEDYQVALNAAFAGGEAFGKAQQRKLLTDAEEVLQALDSCEWNLVRIPPSSWLTDEANQQMAWGVSRTLPPFCSPDGTRVWNGATAIEAIKKGKAAIEAAHGTKE